MSTRDRRLAKLEAQYAPLPPSEPTTFVIRRRVLRADGTPRSVHERVVTLHPDGTRTDERRPATDA